MLVYQRDKWRQDFEAGKVPQSFLDYLEGKTFCSPDFMKLLYYAKALQLNQPTKPPTGYVIDQYRKLRNSESWRSTAVTEQLCEFILFLEGQR
jgi:hypothetical protein